MQRNCWFANSDVPFQGVTNDLLHGQFAMQTYALHQVDVTSELLYSWWFAHAQSNNKTFNGSSCNIGFVCTCFQSHCTHEPPDQKLMCTNPMLHAEPYITYYLLPEGILQKINVQRHTKQTLPC